MIGFVSYSSQSEKLSYIQGREFSGTYTGFWKDVVNANPARLDVADVVDFRIVVMPNGKKRAVDLRILTGREAKVRQC